MSIDVIPSMRSCIKSNTSTILEESGMRNCFEDHIDWLLSRSSTHRVDKYEAYRFNKDLSGYLMQQGVNLGLHWLIMRMNNMKYNWEFTEDTELLYLPDNQDVERLIGLHNAISR